MAEMEKFAIERIKWAGAGGSLKKNEYHNLCTLILLAVCSNILGIKY